LNRESFLTPNVGVTILTGKRPETDREKECMIGLNSWMNQKWQLLRIRNYISGLIYNRQSANLFKLKYSIKKGGSGMNRATFKQ